MTEVVDAAEATLTRAGFQVSRRCVSRASCFDFAARKDKRLIFVKAFPDIRVVSLDDALEIRKLSRCFLCAALFISDRNRDEILKDDTVYSRYGVYVITSKTLEDIFVRRMLPLVEATPGGYYVRINGKKIREKRHELGFSIGKLAEMVGISRRTLYGYETGMTRASVSSAYHLEKVLGVPLVETIDVFNESSKRSRIGHSFQEDWNRIKNLLLRSVIGKLAQFNLKVSPVHRAPFDFAAHCSQVDLKIVGGVFNRRERHLKDRIEEILSLSRVVGAEPLLIGDEEIADEGNPPLINHEKLAKIRNMEDLVALL
ncbi:MAG: helix-turn-helix domain-containing protein [Nitrososphaerota archaeon]